MANLREQDSAATLRDLPVSGRHWSKRQSRLLPSVSIPVRDLRPDDSALPLRNAAIGRRESVGSAIQAHVTTEDAGSLASIDRPPSKEDNIPPCKVYSPYAPATIALLIPASIFGVLARLGLQGLLKYDGASIFGLAYVQALGCLFMGMALRLKEPLGHFYGPLYTAFTTGFCGSLTTFSGWQLDIFDSWINQGDFARDWLRTAIDGCTKLFFTITISLGSLSFGIHLGRLIAPSIPSIVPPPKFLRYSITVLATLMYAATFVTYFKLSPSFRPKATAALLFCFPGTLTRYFLSTTLNPRFKTMPIGTFAANSFGTALLAMFHALKGLPSPVAPVACDLLQGLADGYCGCLTTVSTFAAELSALSVRRRWLYATTTIVTGQLLMLAILGPSFWAGNVDNQAGGSCRME